jgi:uncharacterized HAD superfamily protein
MIVAVDIDDVLNDFVGSMAEFHNKHYGTNLKREDFKTYYLRETLGLDEKEASRRLGEFADSSLEALKPTEDSVEVVRELSNIHKLVVITSRAEKRRELTQNWISSNFPNCFSEVYFAMNHYIGVGNKKKNEICKELGVGIMIEDSMDYALKCSEVGGVFLYDCPWNQKDKLPSSIIRVHGWKDIGRRLIY